MKNEDKGEQIFEFVGTKSKMCPYIEKMLLVIKRQT